PVHRLARLRELTDVAEDELAFAARVAGVDESGHVLSLDELQQRLEARFVLLDRLQREFRRDRRQMRERPLAALHLLFLRHPDLEQMADGRREDVSVAFEEIAMTHEPAERARNVGGDGRYLGDDQRFRHGDLEPIAKWAGR